MSRFSPIREHVLLRWASRMPAAREAALALLTSEALEGVLALVPDAWLLPEAGADTAGCQKSWLCDYFVRRLASVGFLEEAVEAHARLV